jgi:hypothetical protein
MINTWNALDRIEQAERDMPFCTCGRPIVAAARADGIWLECTSFEEPSGSPLERLISAVTSPGHIRRLFIEADAAA